MGWGEVSWYWDLDPGSLGCLLLGRRFGGGVGTRSWVFQQNSGVGGEIVFSLLNACFSFLFYYWKNGGAFLHLGWIDGRGLRHLHARDDVLVGKESR